MSKFPVYALLFLSFYQWYILRLLIIKQFIRKPFIKRKPLPEPFKRRHGEESFTHSNDIHLNNP